MVNLQSVFENKARPNLRISWFCFFCLFNFFFSSVGDCYLVTRLSPFGWEPSAWMAAASSGTLGYFPLPQSFSGVFSFGVFSFGGIFVSLSISSFGFLLWFGVHMMLSIGKAISMVNSWRKNPWNIRFSVRKEINLDNCQTCEILSNLAQVRFTEDEVDEEGNKGECLIRKAQHKKVLQLLLAWNHCVRSLLRAVIFLESSRIL